MFLVRHIFTALFFHIIGVKLLKVVLLAKGFLPAKFQADNTRNVRCKSGTRATFPDPAREASLPVLESVSVPPPGRIQSQVCRPSGVRSLSYSAGMAAWAEGAWRKGLS